MLRSLPLIALAFASSAAAQPVTSQYDNGRTGATTRETVLTPATVNPTRFGKVGAYPVDGDVYAQVLYLPSVAVPGRGRHALIYVATEHNSVYAFDAAATGAPLWHFNLSDVAPNAGPLSLRDVQCPFIRPEVGITSTPVIDTTTGTLYVLARTKEDGRYVQRLHALDVATGAPKHAPKEITAVVRGTGSGASAGVVTFDPLRENPRAGLLLTKGNVILTWASSCDVRPYHGWVMAYDAKTLEQRAVFNATPDGEEGGIWQGDAGPAADAQGRIFVATGNGTFDANRAGGRDYGDTVLELLLDGGAFTVRDFFTPFDQKRMEQEDGDLGSGGPLLIPDQPGARPHLLFTGGKARDVYLLDRDSLGHFDAASNARAVQTIRASGMVMGASAWWNGRVYSAWSEGALKSFVLAGGRLSFASQSAHVFHDPGATPTISANGTRDGIVWVIETKAWNGSDQPAVLHAFDAVDLRRELYSSETNRRDRAGDAVRFTIPTVAAGRVYVGTKGEVGVYGLLKDPSSAMNHEP